MEHEMTSEQSTQTTGNRGADSRRADASTTDAAADRVAEVVVPSTRMPRAPRRAWVALAVLMLPVMLVSIDNTVLSFALPAISRDLAPTAAQQLWIIDAYPLVLAGLLVSMGSAGDRYGRRRMLLIGSIGFAVISVAAAFAPTA
jgi:MFS transporter, DHA2 family, multidrug resistance protein